MGERAGQGDIRCHEQGASKGDGRLCLVHQRRRYSLFVRYGPVGRFQVAEEEALPDIIYGETNIVDEERRSLGLRRLRAPRKLSWKSFRMGMLVCHQSFIPKRAIAPSYDLQYRYSADFDWCIRCMKQARSFCNTHLTCPTSWTAGRARRKEKHPCGRDMRLCANIMVLLLRFCSTAGSPSVLIRRSA